VATLKTATLRGQIQKRIMVTTNEPDVRLTSLTMKAVILGSVVVLPIERIRWSNRPGPAQVDGKVLIRQDPSESGTLHIENVAASIPWLTASWRKLEEKLPAEGVTPPGLPGDWLLQVDVDGQPAPGRTKATLQFETGLTRQPTVVLPVDIDYSPIVTLSEREVVLEVDESGESKKTVLVSLRRGTDGTRLEVTASPEELSAELEASGLRGFKLFLTWNGDAAGQGMVTFALDGEMLVLPVTKVAPKS